MKNQKVQKVFQNGMEFIIDDLINSTITTGEGSPNEKFPHSVILTIEKGHIYKDEDAAKHSTYRMKREFEDKLKIKSSVDSTPVTVDGDFQINNREARLAGIKFLFKTPEDRNRALEYLQNAQKARREERKGFESVVKEIEKSEVSAESNLIPDTDNKLENYLRFTVDSGKKYEDGDKALEAGEKFAEFFRNRGYDVRYNFVSRDDQLYQANPDQSELVEVELVFKNDDEYIAAIKTVRDIQSKPELLKEVFEELKNFRGVEDFEGDRIAMFMQQYLNGEGDVRSKKIISEIKLAAEQINKLNVTSSQGWEDIDGDGIEDRVQKLSVSDRETGEKWSVEYNIGSEDFTRKDLRGVESVDDFIDLFGDVTKDNVYEIKSLASKISTIDATIVYKRRETERGDQETYPTLRVKYSKGKNEEIESFEVQR